MTAQPIAQDKASGDTITILYRMELLEDLHAQVITTLENELAGLITRYQTEGIDTFHMVKALSETPAKLHGCKGKIHHEIFLMKLGAHPEYDDGTATPTEQVRRRIRDETTHILATAQDWVSIDAERWREAISINSDAQPCESHSA